MDSYIKTHIKELNRIRKYLYNLRNEKSSQIYYLLREFDNWFLENLSFRPGDGDTVQRFTIGNFTP